MGAAEQSTIKRARTQRAIPMIATLLISTPTLAAGVLPFDGIYGNPAGCHLYATGEKLNAGYQLLTPDTYSSAAIGCDFGALISDHDVVFTIDAVCSPGGKRQVSVSDLGHDTMSIRLDEQTFAGPLALCPPAGVPGASEITL
jgi:hypothetical protein